MADIFDLFKQISKKEPENTEPITWIIAGLGNPGKKYEHTRHNAGFLTIDRIAGMIGAKIDRVKFQALCGEAVLAGHRVLLMKPQTLMNASGMAVSEAAAFYKIPADHIVVISDDINLDPGHIRARRKGSAGGQKGLNDIITCMGTEEIPRVRMGVGKKPHPDFELADWVLSEFSPKELDDLLAAAEVAKQGIEKILSGNFDAAMQLCNGYLPESERKNQE